MLERFEEIEREQLIHIVKSALTEDELSEAMAFILNHLDPVPSLIYFTFEVLHGSMDHKKWLLCAALNHTFNKDIYTDNGYKK